MSTAIERSGNTVVDLDVRAHPDLRWEDGFHRTMLAAAIAAAAISTYGALYMKLTMAVSQVIPTLLLLLVLLAVAAQYRWRGEHKCFNIVMMVLWAIVITNIHVFPMYMAARQNVAMSDATLAAIDRAVGLEVPAVLEYMKSYPLFSRFLQTIYNSLLPLMTVATVVPPVLNRMDKAREYALACIIAAAIGMPIFAIFQAVGPWEYYGFPPSVPTLAAKADMLAALKTDSLFVIDFANRDGLIEFPSFHVILTVLAASTLWAFPKLRWPVCVWAALIVVSTVTTGIHYVADVGGGLLIAVCAAAGARKWVRIGQAT